MGEKGRIVFSPDWERNNKEKGICKALEQVTSKVGAKSITSGVYLPQPHVLQKKADHNSSCHCIHHAQNALRLLYHQWPESRASLPAFNTLVQIMATRCILSAEYFCSGSVARDMFGHYRLASPIYTPFTSPIRQYRGLYPPSLLS